jgi:hypothetical protein
MDLIEIDVIGGKGSQTLLDASLNPFRAGIAGHTETCGSETSLCGNNQFVASPALERLSQKPLGGAEAVCLRRVEEVHAVICGPADSGHGLLGVCCSPVTAELPRTKCNP